MALGCKYGTHRVIEPVGALPQTAQKLNNDMSTIWDNEILLDVIALNIDSASFTQIEEEAHGDVDKIAAKIMEIVSTRGKQQNPVTGSGGMFIGKVAKIGSALQNRDLKVGDKIASLVSLSLTPLKINKILKVMPEVDRVLIDGQAILFESGIYAKLPDDMDEGLALAALDVAGAPAQTAKLVKPGDRVLILGAGGKSGMLCCYEAMKRVGP
ncbi:MAG TPA: L-erythro-3,5-diaminohexanoate dehydrogenase, partial [Spirochaetales bacterium]|nr:L-erythro-3,5-diaminohexanoate dehydrogenase [Spirochaetales bacterium]